MFEKILKALTKDESKDNGGFYAEHELKPSDIQIEVEGIGPIHFPLCGHDIQNLIALSSKAKFGLREQTLLDETVRDTHEIPADQLRVTINPTSLNTLLTQIGSSLGISENAKLIPHLHNLLIYGPGQFFNKHQDSEKEKDMIGTLVIALPVPHIGGDLVVSHTKKQHVFSSENIDCPGAKCFAFYADCHHEVQKVTQGHRLALTYNLVLESKESSIKTYQNPLLKKALEEYFSIKGKTEPLKLVYFLDHSYTEHSLRWDLLKGTDRINALTFRDAAKKLHLISHLALVEIHETWTAEGDEEDLEIGELIDHGTTLSHWIDINNQKEPYRSYPISEDCICLTKETEEFDPFEEEYEGYMGNYGNTMDYWYRRAALVLWQESDQIFMNFYLNYEEAMKELLEFIKTPGNESKVLERVEKAGDCLWSQNKNKNDFKTFAEIGLYIQNKESAKPILSHFEWSILDFDIAENLVKLQNLYGTSWCLDLMTYWKQSKQSYIFDKVCLLKNISSFVSTFLSYGGDGQLVDFLLKTQIETIIKNDKHISQYSKPADLRRSLPERMTTLQNTLKACCFVPKLSALRILLTHLLSNPTLYPEPDLVDLLLTPKENDKIPFEQKNDYKAFHDHLEKTIREELSLGLRSEEDWSIQTKLPCRCEDCRIAMDFLRSKTDIKKVWPIVMSVREHIMNTFRGLDLPVDLSVEKQGSPHKLILVKNDKLYKAAKERFDNLTLCHQKLKLPFTEN